MLRRISSVLIFAVVLMAPSMVNAQSGTPALACDATFGADAAALLNNLPSTGSMQPADLAQVAVKLAKIRVEYEDLIAPAGCEIASRGYAQLAGLDEDAALLGLFSKLDSQGTAYYDFLGNVLGPRFSVFQASLAATPDASAASNTGGVCADAAFQKQVFADLKGMGTPDMTAVNSLGTALLALLKLRYQYEDATAPAGCSLAKRDMVLVLAASEDLVLSATGALEDKANVALYSDFQTNVVGPRGSKIYNAMFTDLGLASTLPVATAAS